MPGVHNARRRVKYHCMWYHVTPVQHTDLEVGQT